MEHRSEVPCQAPVDLQLRERVRQMLEEQRRLVDQHHAQIGEDVGKVPWVMSSLRETQRRQDERAKVRSQLSTIIP